MKAIELELARKIMQQGQYVQDITSPFVARDGKKCRTTLMIYDYKFFTLTTANVENGIALMKQGHHEITLEIAKVLFHNKVDFMEIVTENPISNNQINTLRGEINVKLN